MNTILVFCYQCGTQKQVLATILTRSHQDFHSHCDKCGETTHHHRVHT